MISSITGRLEAIGEDRIEVSLGPMVLDVLIPASDMSRLSMLLHQEVTLYTVLYLEGDPSRGTPEPRLIGFLAREDRAFFHLFTTVKGIGPRTALRALSQPVDRIATAIESRDVKFLTQLKGIGKRTAELMVAELAGKLEEFAGAVGHVESSARRPAFEEDAILAILQLDDRMRRPEAETLVEKAKAEQPDIASTDALLRLMLRLRG